MKSFEEALARLTNVGVNVAGVDVPDSEGTARIAIKFSNGAVLNTYYWRLIQNGRAELSSFDHQQKYGLPESIDAKAQISGLLSGTICNAVQLDSETADLTLVFSESTKLQVFNFSGYEMWEFQFPDGAVEYSNYALGE